MTTDSHKSAMSAATDRRSDPPRGFTLVELIITIALIAILAALAVPSLQNVTRQGEGRSTARAISNAFRMARDEAMSRGEVVFAKVDNDGGTGSQGLVELYRTENGETHCRIASPDDSDDLEVHSVEVRKYSGELSIQGSTHSDPMWVCMSPTGEVLNKNGNEFSDEDNTCGQGVYRIWLAEESPDDVEKKCEPEDEADRTEQRNERYLSNFWVVEIPYNGGFRIIQ